MHFRHATVHAQGDVLTNGLRSVIQWCVLEHLAVCLKSSCCSLFRQQDVQSCYGLFTWVMPS
jgi:hypothetical protein